MNSIRKPSWLKVPLTTGEKYYQIKNLIKKNHLHTICESGNCPNKGECWNRGVATFMILGNICTRSCKFCNVISGKPLAPDSNEPLRVARSVQILGLHTVVITSVDRDDLPDFGASFWAQTIISIKQLNPQVKIEALIPDFQGNYNLVDVVLKAKPDIVSHNLETVRRLNPIIRTKANYETSLNVLQHIVKNGFIAKSGIMLGLGETLNEVLETMDDLAAIGCKIITIGQYLQPSPDNIKVQSYLPPNDFKNLEREAIKRGFTHVSSAPLVRSSYYAENHFQ